jgi:hypothetical protein
VGVGEGVGVPVGVGLFVIVGVKVGSLVRVGVGVRVMVGEGRIGVGVRVGIVVWVMVGVAVGGGASKSGYEAIRNTRVNTKINRMTRLVNRKRILLVSSGAEDIAALYWIIVENKSTGYLHQFWCRWLLAGLHRWITQSFWADFLRVIPRNTWLRQEPFRIMLIN